MSAASPLSLADTPAPLATIHASAIVVGESGILLRGPSGAGKSATALAVVAAAGTAGIFGRIVADDRVVLRRAGGRLLVSAHPRIAGRIERRFQEISAVETEAMAVARLVVDLLPEGAPPPSRLPSEEGRMTHVAGVALPRLILPHGLPDAPAAILHALREIVRWGRD